jgi:hypothetical protein
MAQEFIDIGANPDDGTGDNLREGGQKINSNFTELYLAISDLRGEIDYQGMEITSFSATPPGPFELGSAPSITLNWSLSDTATTQTLVDSVAGAATLPNPAGDRSKVVAPNSSRSFTLTSTNSFAPGGPSSDSAIVSVQFIPRRFWGASSSTTLDAAAIIALSGTDLGSSRAKSATVNAGSSPGQYVYIAYPTSFGDQTTYKLFGFDEVPIKTTVSVTTAAGATMNYTVLRSPNMLTGSVPVEIS